ncbi:MAG: TrkH family potassium uptake protein [Verrucomicrobiota bacterium]
MNFRSVLKVISFLLMVIGVGMAASWGVSLYFKDPSAAQHGLMISTITTLVTAVVLRILTRGAVDLTWRDGIGIGTLGWFVAALFGALPYVLSGVLRDPVAALFETVSGFTTTGASVITVVEPVAKGILFWRALTHFFGGMGILVLCVAILPFLGFGGMQLYRAEVSGLSQDRLTPRIATTAKLLWGVYVLLTILETVLLKLGGMSWFDALCHSFASIATGGFSTRTVSIAAYDSLYIEVVITVFMLLGATNFALHYSALRGNVSAYWKNSEFRFYLGLWAAACAVVTFNTWHSIYPTLSAALRNSVFSTTSLMTTTGFSTADFDRWPAFSKTVLLLLMVAGACVGSTGGGIKQMRLLVALKKILRQTKQFMHPQAVLQVKIGKEPVGDDTVLQILAFFILYVLVLVVASVVMTLFTHDMVSAFSSVIATTGGVGPGLGLVGPLQNYAAIPSGGKIVLILCMLLGRLEFYTMLALLFPSFWKK